MAELQTQINNLNVAVIIPAFNEEASIGKVLQSLPEWVRYRVVVDNNSTDRTAAVAASHGAMVVKEPRKGYGYACLAGMHAVGINTMSHAYDPVTLPLVHSFNYPVAPDVDVVVFLDADASDKPEAMAELINPILNNQADLVIGSRTLGRVEKGAMTFLQKFGNQLACKMIRCLYNYRMTDLGPFRAIRSDALVKLQMDDCTFGWTVQMQTRAIQMEMRMQEIPVDYGKRIGKSKISGTVKGVIGAGWKIVSTILKEYTRRVSCDGEVVLFSRLPEPGSTKTRMIPALGKAGAAELQTELTEHVIGQLKKRSGGCADRKVQLFYTGDDRAAMKNLYGEEGIAYYKQVSGDLGRRMTEAFVQAKGQPAVIVGADCPFTTSHLADTALQLLNDQQPHHAPLLVLGPASDGGFYLIGLSYIHPELLNQMTWGHERVLKDVTEKAEKLGYRVVYLPTRHDIDLPHDLPHWDKAQRLLNAADEQSISIIIPTLNEGDQIARTLKKIRKITDGVEIIVVDGGSTDNTAALAKEHDVKVTQSERGRAKQMNRGAEIASSAILLFLHADTTLPASFEGDIRDTLAGRNVSVGAFCFNTDKHSVFYKAMNLAVNVRSRYMEMPYGDQGLFMTKQTYRTLKGFPDTCILEDYLLVKNARKIGRVRLTKTSVITSSRKWEIRGRLKMTLINQLTLWGYRFGVPLKALVKFRK